MRDITKIIVSGGNIDHERLLGESSKCKNRPLSPIAIPPSLCVPRSGKIDFPGTDLKLLTLNDAGYIFLWEGRDLLRSRVCFEVIVKVVDLAVAIDGSLLIVSKMVGFLEQFQLAELDCGG